MKMVITYDQIKYPARKNLPCPVCGKKVRRSFTFISTANPWNKNPDGSLRTVPQIREMLAQEAADWGSRPEMCSSCRENM